MTDLSEIELNEVSLLKQKVIEMFKQVQAMFRTCFDGLMKNDIRSLDQALSDEDKVTKAYNDLTTHAVGASKKNLSGEAKKIILDLVDIASAIERIGDSCVGLVERIEYKISEKLLFSEAAVEEYRDLHSKIEKILSDTVGLIKTDDKKIAREILETESAIAALVDKYRVHHIERSARGICDEWARVRYLDMLDLTKEVAQHCIEIAARFAEK